MEIYTFILTVATVFTDTSFETASAWRDVLVQPGTYTAKKDGRDRYRFSLPGICTADYYQHRLYGHTMPVRDRLKGQECSYSFCVFSWDIKKMAGAGVQTQVHGNVPMYGGGTFERNSPQPQEQ